MPAERSNNLFAALNSSLAEFRFRVEGEPGRQVAGVGTSKGAIPEVVRKTIESLGEALQLLHNGVMEGEKFAPPADAAIAGIEVLAEIMPQVAAGLSFGELPETLGISSAPFTAVGKAVETAGSRIEKALRIAQLLPTPEEISGLRIELEKLLGAGKTTGSLGKLMDEIGVQLGGSEKSTAAALRFAR